MKVGIDASGVAGWRGPSRNARNIIRSLAAVGKEHRFFLFAPYALDEFITRSENVQDVRVPLHRGVSWNNISLPWAVRKYHLDVFLFTHANFWVWKPLKTVVLTRAAVIGAWTDAFIDHAQTFVQRHRFKHIADKVGAVSHFNASQIRLTCRVPDRKFEVIYNGVDPVFQDPRIPPYTGYGDYILFTGGTEPRKNITRLLEAYRILDSRGIAVKLVLVGGKYAPGEPEIQYFGPFLDHMSEKGRVIFHGAERDSVKLAALYKGAKAVVYPSLQEDFGMVSVEAFASGVPLVASNAPSIPEIAGDAAVYFDPYEVEEMAGKIERVLCDAELRKDLVARGRERVKRYDWNVSARKLLDLLKGVADAR